MRQAKECDRTEGDGGGSRPPPAPQAQAPVWYQRIVVAVPARNEADCVGECVTSIDRAARAVAVPVTVVVAADSCQDATAEVLARLRPSSCRLYVLEGTWGRAGTARAAAIEFGLCAQQHGHRYLPGNAAGQGQDKTDELVWIANTDADCVVPPSWLQTQLLLAKEVEAVAGIVELDRQRTPAGLFEAFNRTYAAPADVGTAARVTGHDGEVEDHEHVHVHGANIGLCAMAYQAVGGWCPFTVVGEDHALWDALRSAGRRIRQTTALRVATSARTRSRVDGGFATDLANLDRAPAERGLTPARGIGTLRVNADG